jgi:iron complex outermembrane receptor protein
MLSSVPLLPAPPSLRMHRIAAAAALAALHFGASAQTTPETGKLPTVNVTAERRTENIQDLPNSVTAINAETIDILNTSGQDVRVLSARVPSLNIESSFGRAFPRFYIRGYGNTDFRLNASQPVSLVYDDIVQENPILKGFPAFDLDRIEVLRGPQGTLFGRNTPAGVVKFESVRPSTKKVEGYGSLSYGTFNTVNAEGAVNVPVTPSSALRLSVLNQTRDDWVENTYEPGPTQELEGYRDSALRAQLLVEPTKDLSVLGNIHARDYRGSARLFRANIIQAGTNNLIPGFDESKIFIDGKNDSELQNYGANLRVRWGLGDMALYSITGYEQVRTYSGGDIDGGTPGGPGIIFFPVETADGMPTHRQITQEFRLESTGSGPLAWQAGVYLFNEDYKVESFSYDSTTPGNPQNGYERIHQRNNAYALFGALTYAVSPTLKLRAGLRYTWDDKKLNVEEFSGGLENLDATAGDTKDNKASGDLSATWTVQPGLNVYGRLANGFRASSIIAAGAFNGQSIGRPETNTSVEAGVKADLLDGRARVNLGVFHYTVKDQQLTAVGGESNANRLINAKKTVGQGFELDAQALVTDQLMLGLGLGYNKTKIKDPTLAVFGCAQCTVTDPAGPVAGTFVIDGNPLPQAPETTASFMLKYSQPTPNGEWYVLTDWTYRSKINFFLYESVEFTGKALTEGGLRLGYLWGNGKYEAALFGRNITNQIRVVGGIDFNNLTGFINEPRTWGAQFRATF